MDDGKWLAVLIGVLGALAGVYLREAVRSATLKRRIAIQIEAYLLIWERFLLDSDLAALKIVADERRKEINQALVSKNHDAFADTLRKFEDKLSEIKADLQAEESMAVLFDKFREKVSGMSESCYNEAIKELDRIRDAVLRNQIFVSDAEAAMVSRGTGMLVVSIRTNACSLLSKLKWAYVSLRHTKEANPISWSGPVAKSFGQLVILVQDIGTLRNKASVIASMPIHSLIVKELCCR